MATPPSRFVIVPQQRSPTYSRLLYGLLWLVSLGLVGFSAYRYATHAWVGALDDLGSLEKQVVDLRADNHALAQKVSVLGRSDQVSREALNQLQADLAARDEEIAGLRADVVFYERLVGGSAKRKGLSIHSVQFDDGGEGGQHFSITLTQNLKKSGATKGSLKLSVEGVKAGKLTRLEWNDLRQDENAEAVPFEFRYFQQVEGSVMFPAGFTPHRVQVEVDRDGSRVRESLSWEDTRKGKGG